MHDLDGPSVAQVVYGALTQMKSKTFPVNKVLDILADSYSSVISKTLTKEDKSDILVAIYPIITQCLTTANTWPYRVLMDQGFSSVSSESLPDSAAKAIEKALVDLVDNDDGYFSVGVNLPLAPIVDALTRHLRKTEKLPPSRWAVFVHVGM